ncbi:MAG TPA: DUF45 domain-containing protein, partial [Bacteroidetes bacterium]|nr:DUF45 domain-containing protein [Bacteroidota bacterium]
MAGKRIGAGSNLHVHFIQGGKLSIAEQQLTLQIGDSAIPYAVKQGNPNRVRLSFSEDNLLCIETGSGNLGQFERNFILSKAKWILKGYRERLKDFEKKNALLSALETQILLLGKETKIDYLESDRTYFRYKTAGPFSVYAPARYIQAHRKTLLYHALRKFAGQYLGKRLDHWSEECKLDFNQLRIKDLKSKWGSCSSKRNINLNWQLVFLEEELIDYVIIHELM